MNSFIKENYNKKHDKIKIKAIHANDKIEFLSFITNFSDNKNSSWSSTVIYNKMDPISVFQNTTRKISIGFSVPSSTIEIARENFAKVNLFLNYLYPLYEEGDVPDARGAAIINTPPIFRILFTNLISYGDPDNDSGLLGWIDSLKFEPDLEAGLFAVGAETIYPKLYKISFTFNVLHEKFQGWSSDIRNSDGEIEAQEEAYVPPPTPPATPLEASRATSDYSPDSQLTEEELTDRDKFLAGYEDTEFVSFLKGNLPEESSNNLDIGERTELYRIWRTFNQKARRRKSSERTKLKDLLLEYAADSQISEQLSAFLESKFMEED